MFMAWCFPPHRSVFRGPRFQSVSLTTMNTSSFSHPATAGPDTGIANLPDSILFGCRYWLELCIDPLGLPRLVPAAPDFSSQPHRGFPLCVKPTSRVQVAPSRAPPGRELLSFHLRQGSAGFRAPAPWCRGTSPFGPFPRRPISPRGGLGRTGHCSLERPSQPYEPHYGHTATAHARSGLVRPTTWPGWWPGLGLLRPVTAVFGGW
jgi:hypothetical protein